MKIQQFYSLYSVNKFKTAIFRLSSFKYVNKVLPSVPEFEIKFKSHISFSLRRKINACRNIIKLQPLYNLVVKKKTKVD